MICRSCGVEKGLTDFVRDKYTLSGYKRTCHCCNRVQAKKWRQCHPTRVRENINRWRRTNQDYWNAYCKYWRGTITEFTPKPRLSKRTREEARTFLKENKKRYDQVNYGKTRAYQAKNRKRITQVNKRWKQKHKRDTNYRIANNLRTRFKKVLTNPDHHRHQLFRLLGCNITFFRGWIERNFEQGMSWENYGVGPNCWHIDHNLPCASFDLTKLEERRKCFHWSNLFPMWSKQNLSKGRRLRVNDYSI